jgi:hypothetical protein
MLDRDFFKQYQRQLRWFANTRLGRWFFRIQTDTKILGIGPNSLTWRDGEQYKTEFRTHAKYAKRINSLFAWLPFNAVKHYHIGNQWYFQPKLGLTTSTFNPDADPETTSVDGHFATGLNTAWATLRNATTAGTVNDSSQFINACGFLCGSSLNNFFDIRRSMFLFDTSALGDSDTITATVLSLWGRAKEQNHANNDIVLNAYAATPASNTALVADDYDNYGATDTGITYDSWDGTDTVYNDLAFNASGIAAVSKTGVTKIGCRDTAFDVANVAPTWSSEGSTRFFTYGAEEASGSKDPKLVVTHSSATAYTITADQATFALTGVAAALLRGYLMAAALATFTLSGIDAALSKGKTLVADVGSFALTGITATLTLISQWTNLSKAVTSWTEGSKNSTSWTNGTKNTTTFSNTSKNSTSYTNQTKNSTSWTNIDKS